MSRQPEIEPMGTKPILELQQVCFRKDGETSIDLDRFSARVLPGQLIKVTLHRRHDPRDLASLLIGLHQPYSGVIRYDGQDWLGLDYTRHFKMRSRIGRVFAGSAWIQSLTVRDNIQLSMSHHRIPPSKIKSKMDDWTERLSGSRVALIKQAMRKRPSFVEPSVLQVCQFIRAFMQRPKLLILERPLQHLVDELQSNLGDAIDERRLRGTAVLWFAGGGQDRDRVFRKPLVRWTLDEDSLISQGGSTR